MGFWSVCVYVCSRIIYEGLRSPVAGMAALWVLGTKLRLFGRAASAALVSCLTTLFFETRSLTECGAH